MFQGLKKSGVLQLDGWYNQVEYGIYMLNPTPHHTCTACSKYKTSRYLTSYVTGTWQANIRYPKMVWDLTMSQSCFRTLGVITWVDALKSAPW